MAYKFLEHTADTKIQVTEKNLELAFKESAYALKETIAGKIKIKSKIEKQIQIKGRDSKNLLYMFLEEFLFLLDAQGFVLAEIKSISIDRKTLILNATLLGDKASNYKISNDVKAITYNDMSIKETKATKKAQSKIEIIFVLDV